MRLLSLCSFLLAGASFLPAQDAVILPYPVPPSRFEELRSYLTLSDTQVIALQQVMQGKSDAENAIYRTIQQKYETLNNLLATPSPDPFQVGRLTVEIRDLQKQVPLNGEPYRSNALNVLTAAQKQKLPSLSAALQTATPAYQAVTLNLIDAPQRSGINPLELPYTTTTPASAKLKE